MARWLLKSEPDCYSYDDLVRDGSTLWDGVTNALALKHLRAFAAGDEVFYYLTGKVKAVVGLATVTAATVGDDKQPAVTIAANGTLANPVTLAAVKAEGGLAKWELVTNSRLSVMPVPDAAWKRVMELANG